MKTIQATLLALALTLLAAATTRAATLVVTNAADSGAGSLRAVVAGAASGDTIIFTNTLSGQTILLTSGQILLATNLTIDGSALTNPIQINGNHASRVFNVQTNRTILLTQLLITNAFGSSVFGGGIYSEGTLTVSNCTFAGNSASSGGGAIHNEEGTLTVRNSTFSTNTTPGEGGAISDHGPLVVNNCTFTTNSANAGGAIRIITVGGGDPISVATFRNCTFAGNAATAVGADIYNYQGTLNLTNCILLTGFANSGANTTNNFANNLIGVDAQLSPLGNNGGPTQTMPPLPGSPAIDAGTDIVTSLLATDQRGSNRLSGLHVDIGAVELAVSAPIVTTSAATAVTNIAATLNGTVNPANLATTWYFQYGLTTSYGSTTVVSNLVAGSSPVAVSNAISGLLPGTTYHFSLVGSNSVGTNAGADLTFTTSNQAPTDIALSGSSVPENSASNTTVGSFSDTDSDPNDSATYTLVSGAGSTDNASFNIVNGTNLNTAAVFDYETKNSYSIRVRVTDRGGLFFEKQFTISVINVIETPLITTPTSANITDTAATLGANVTSDGGAPITQRGVVYSITTSNSNPLIGGPGVTLVSAPGTTGVFTVNVTGLTPVTGYSFKGYVINTDATNYTTPVSAFTTFAAATVVTLPATAMSNSVATLNGTVIPGSGATAWFEWGLSPFTNAATTSPVTLGGGTNPIAISNLLSGLTPGLIYHYRAIASNALGVVRGLSVPFGSPAIALNGGATVTNECHTAFTDPGATVTDSPLAIAAGGFDSLALKSDGTVVAWGAGTNNTGSGTSFGQSIIPAGLSNVVAVAGGYYHSLALKSDGTVAAWGAGTNNTGFPPTVGQSIIPAGLSNVVAVAAGAYHSLALKSGGTVTAWGDNEFGQTSIPAGLSNVVAVAAGGYYSLALKNDGTVMAWGDNSLGQTNIPVGLSNVVAIAGGYYHSLALKSDGTVAAWGAGTNNTGFPPTVGQSIIPAGLSNVVAIAGGLYHSLALKSDGTLTAWGAGTNNTGSGFSFGQSIIPAGLSNVVAIDAGGYHSLALKSDGTLTAWGAGTNNTGSGFSLGQSIIPAGLTNLTNINVTVSGGVNTNTPGSYVLNYSATNRLRGFAAASRTVVVQDTTPPVITMLGSNPLTNLVNVSFVDPGATALDACGGSFAVSNNSTVNVNALGSYTVTYSSTDSFSNTANVVRTVVVVNPPTFTGLTAMVVGTNAANGARTVQFTAVVNPNGLATSVNVQYGLTSAYAGTNGPVNLPASYTSSNVNLTVAGFSYGFTYHWNVTGATIGGSASAPDQIFTIGTPPGSGIPGDINGDGIVSQSELDAVYANYVTNSPWLYMTNVAGLGGTNVTFSLSNSVLGAYTVLYSTNLTDWYPLGPASPQYIFTDTNAPAMPQRYYRLRYP